MNARQQFLVCITPLYSTSVNGQICDVV